MTEKIDGTTSQVNIKIFLPLLLWLLQVHCSYGESRELKSFRGNSALEIVERSEYDVVLQYVLFFFLKKNPTCKQYFCQQRGFPEVYVTRKKCHLASNEASFSEQIY